MAALRSWLHTQQSICSLLPCRRLPDCIREVLYHREMKMSEFSRSCSVSCGTSMFWSTVGVQRRVRVPACHIAPFPGSVKMAYSPSRVSRLPAYGYASRDFAPLHVRESQTRDSKEDRVNFPCRMRFPRRLGFKSSLSAQPYVQPTAILAGFSFQKHPYE